MQRSGMMPVLNQGGLMQSVIVSDTHQQTVTTENLALVLCFFYIQ